MAHSMGSCLMDSTICCSKVGLYNKKYHYVNKSFRSKQACAKVLKVTGIHTLVLFSPHL